MRVHPIKYYKPDKLECIECDCGANGLMIFQGEDHAHFRESLEFDYYNILLLHYRNINCRYCVY